MLKKITSKSLLKYGGIVCLGCILSFSACKKENTEDPVVQPKRVIINVDMDSDDCMAILYLMNAPGIEVIGVTVTGNGFMLPDQGVPVALQVVALGGQPNIPVSYGTINSIVPYGGFPEAWRVPAVKFYANNDFLQPITTFPSPYSSAELIVNLIHKSPTKVTILGVGPSTNIALALRESPDIVNNIEEIVLMGGAFAPCEGNIVNTPPTTVFEETASYRAQIAMTNEHNSAEYNIILDVGSLATILQCGVPVTISPLNASQNVPVTATVLNPLKALNTPMANFICGIVEPLINQ